MWHLEPSLKAVDSEFIAYVSYLLKDLREVEQGLAGLLEQAGHGGLISHSDLALPHIKR
jgi:hypothetical protein